ncbi:MAG: type II toxin-antitoxin system VapC family toxin [Desulfatirhabdiaceae bacterium]
MGKKTSTARVEIKELIIVDTDILIDIALKISDAINYVNNIENQFELAVSIITQMELYAGCRNKAELKNIEQFLKRFAIFRINEHISEKAVRLFSQYRLSHGLAIPDALIAATAIILKKPLISKNQRDYCFIKGLNLLPYP